MAKIIPLKDDTGAQFYPQTHERAVVDSNGVNLETKLANLTSDISLHYGELVTLRNSGKLIPGHYYRITDYTTTTTDTESRSAGHVYDVIVFALDENTLSEEAYAARHAGDSYFGSSNLTAWKLWYCLDNDTARFGWADNTNGKGVIYRMIDEWGNDLPYDYKNIQFKRYRVTAKSDFTDYLSGINGLFVGLPGENSYGLDVDTSAYKWYYTFTQLGQTWDDVTDASISGANANNSALGATSYSSTRTLNNAVFANGQALQTFILSVNSSSTQEFDRVSIDNKLGDNANYLSIFGACYRMNGKSLFRRNIIIGGCRHTSWGTNFQDNTIAVFDDNAFHDFTSAAHVANNVVYSVKSLWRFRVYDQVQRNKLYSTARQIVAVDLGNISDCVVYSTSGSYDFQRAKINFAASCELYGLIVDSSIALIQNCVFGTKGSQVSIEYCTIETRLGFCNFYGIVKNCSFASGMFTYLNVNAPLQYSSFAGIMSYVTIPTSPVSGGLISLVDIPGGVRGTSNSARVSLSAPEFYLTSVAGKNRIIRIESDSDGGVIATWRGASGVLTGKRTTDNGQTWTNL